MMNPIGLGHIFFESPAWPCRERPEMDLSALGPLVRTLGLSDSATRKTCMGNLA